MFELSEFETGILKNAKTFLNERAIARGMKRNRSGKRVKGRRKKTKEFEKTLGFQGTTTTHAVEALIGSLKMAIIIYLNLDCKESQIEDWVYGIEKRMALAFQDDMRAEACKNIICVYEGNGNLFKPLAVNRWFFKSGFIKRSNNLFKELYGDIIQYAYSDEIRQLRDSYLEKAGHFMATPERIKLISFDETTNVDQDDYDFLISITNYKIALDYMIEDLHEDKKFLKKIKYLRSQIGTLCDIMKEYISSVSDDLEKMTELSKEFSELKKLSKELGKYFTAVKNSCEMEGIKLSESTRSIWQGYLEYLQGLDNKKLNFELKWLGVA